MPVFFAVLATSLLILLVLWSFFQVQMYRRVVTNNNIMLHKNYTGAELIEKYCAVMRKIKVTVHNPNVEFATAEKNHLIVNREHVYRRDLQALLMYCAYCELTKAKSVHLSGNRLQVALFIFQIFCVFLAWSVHWLISIPAILVALGLLVSGFYRKASFYRVRIAILAVAQDLLDLEQWELAAADKVMNSWQNKFHWYAWEGLVWLKDFLVPDVLN